MPIVSTAFALGGSNLGTFLYAYKCLASLQLSFLAVHFKRRDDGVSGKDSGSASLGSQSWIESIAQYPWFGYCV